MTAVVITPSLDPSWVRPLAALRARGVACVVLSLDAAAFDRYVGGQAAILACAPRPLSTTGGDEVAKRARALRHALAEYELRSFAITPGRALGEILAQ